MSLCNICPRRCNADRSGGQYGVCKAGSLPGVARAALHFWEEPCISGSRGSGTVFFCGCNLSCLFCQNYDISTCANPGKPFDEAGLVAAFLRLQELGAHNINLVTPTTHTEMLIKALSRARLEGLKIPVVYNTNGYELVETLKRLDGLVDVYLPDIKYASACLAARYSNAEDYFAYAAPAVLEMQRQCGTLKFDAQGLAVRGVLIRHLVLPGSVDETRSVLDFIAQNLPASTWISLMCQYAPAHKADFKPLNRRLTRREYDRAVEYCLSLGLNNVFIQELSSADLKFTPDFNSIYE